MQHSPLGESTGEHVKNKYRNSQSTSRNVHYIYFESESS